MAVKIRLARHGKKAAPFYHIVATDSRAPRDGKFIEKIGTYNPVSNPAKVEINFDRAIYWLQNGAQPSDTAKSILRGEGILYMKHLMTGLRKGAFDQAVLDQRFAAWKEKNAKVVSALQSKLVSDKEQARRKQQEAEVVANKVRAEKIAKKQQDAAAKASEAAAPESAE
jgi:small subunit ribosomal protein S16